MFLLVFQGGEEWSAAASEIVVTVVGTVVGGVMLTVAIFYLNKLLIAHNSTPEGQQDDRTNDNVDNSGVDHSAQ